MSTLSCLQSLHSAGNTPVNTPSAPTGPPPLRSTPDYYLYIYKVVISVCIHMSHHHGKTAGPSAPNLAGSSLLAIIVIFSFVWLNWVIKIYKLFFSTDLLRVRVTTLPRKMYVIMLLTSTTTVHRFQIKKKYQTASKSYGKSNIVSFF